MGETRYPSNRWVFKGCVSFQVRQHGQPQFYYQYKACWFLYKMVGAPSFSQSYLYMQPALQSPTKIYFSTSANFHLSILPLIVHKIILTITYNTPILNTSVIFQLLILPYNLPNNLHQKYVPTSSIGPIQAASRDQEVRKSCEDWHCFNLLPSSLNYGQW